MNKSTRAIALRLFKVEFLLSSLVAGAVLLLLTTNASASTMPMGGKQPADVYCSDLQQGVDDAYKKAMQNRMPADSPGGHMDKNYDVQATVEKEIDYGLGSPGAILKQLFSLITSKAEGFKEKIITDTVNKTMQDAMGRAKSTVSMPSTGETPQSSYGTVSKTPAPSDPIVGYSASAQNESILSKMSNFFNDMFR